MQTAVDAFFMFPGTAGTDYNILYVLAPSLTSFNVSVCNGTLELIFRCINTYIYIYIGNINHVTYIYISNTIIYMHACIHYREVMHNI